ncbi:3'-5' exonuclease [Nocardia bovistercoris]|uniref:DNA 3'-5' helicase n=1 Tax=Nocardia bovistercoris TaxID=2785916 RepID=A0A931IF04_9NOCA|nr:3'-5' exonuclease [Nocardia bovistercoris]MBH0779338.1 AAA family ATPase [Nocardia bovistercoris]
MVNIVMGNKALGKLDGSVKSRVYDFLDKLQTDHTAPGLHIEPLRIAVDSRVRTGRVDLNHRAVLFRIDPDKGETTYIYMGTWKHDDANAYAERAVLRVNPVNGILEGILAEPETAAPPVAPRPGARAAEPVPGYLAGVGFTLADLTERLGFDPAFAARALTAPDEDAINDLAVEADGWQGSALFDLACGKGIDDVRATYVVAEQPLDPALGEDDRIIEALAHPSSRMQFTYIEGSEELRRVIEGGDFSAWRVFLHPQQRAFAEKSYSGPFRISGGAGTGKTVVALHRAKNLADRNPGARIVLTTFNRTLAKELENSLRVLDPDLPRAAKPGEPGIYVDSVDRLANALVQRGGDLGPAAEALFGAMVEVGTGRTEHSRLWREVIETVDSGLDRRLATESFLESEYVSVVLANRVTAVEQYVKVARAGRGVRLSRPQRIAVWKLVEAFRRRSRMDGTLSFPEVLALAAEHLRLAHERGAPRPADHVIVDEAQDLHATHWAMLRTLVAEGPDDLFIAEDSHQRIYGQPVVLSRMGIKITGRSRRLTLNYRTTAQNLRFAVGILSGAEYHDLVGERESTLEYRSARNGPTPRPLPCDSAVDELDKVAATIRAWLADDVDPSTIAVLTRSKNERSQFVRGLAERGVEARALDDSPITSGHVQVLTMHRAKGMEFSRVILAGIDEGHVPAKAALAEVPDEERGEAELRERSLLYVAASRARDELVVTWSGRRSQLLG